MCIYKTFILCHFNYCPIVWHFTGKTNAAKLEKIQERALRFVFNVKESCYADLLAKANMPSLELSRLRQLGMEVYKAIHGLSPSFICDIFDKTDPLKLHVLQPRTTSSGIRSFRYQGAKIWNSLPVEFKQAPNIQMFKRLIKTWEGPKCTCTYCKSNLYETNHLLL